MSTSEQRIAIIDHAMTWVQAAKETDHRESAPVQDVADVARALAAIDLDEEEIAPFLAGAMAVSDHLAAMFSMQDTEGPNLFEADSDVVVARLQAMLALITEGTISVALHR